MNFYALATIIETLATIIETLAWAIAIGGMIALIGLC